MRGVFLASGSIVFGFIIVLSSLSLLPTAEASGEEFGEFPHRTFIVTRTHVGSPRADAYVTSAVSPVPALWWVRLESGRSAVVVQVSHSNGGIDALDGSWRLREVGAESTPITLRPNVPYRITFIPYGRQGPSVLTEHVEANASPSACFTVYPNPASVSENVHFDASCSTDLDGDIVAYLWDLGDGTTADGRLVDHGYPTLGEYRATLRVVDSRGDANATAENVTVLPDATQLAPPHSDRVEDEDGDGLSDVLIVDVRVAVAKRDWFADFYGRYFRVSGWAEVGDRLLSAETVLLLDPGFQTIPLRFPGSGFRIAGVPGPYIVNLNLFHSPTNTFLGEGSHGTAEYDPTSFEGAPARFEPPHGDSGVGADGDGQYEQFAADLGLQVLDPGEYWVTGSLTSGDGTRWIASTSTSQFLEPGRVSIRLQFPGELINRSRTDGPYRLELSLFAPAIGVVLDRVVLMTQGYRSDDFNGPRVFFLGPHADRGLDRDGDGLFESLSLDIGLVSEAGNYFLQAVLGIGSPDNLTRSITTSVQSFELTDGVQHVTIDIVGRPINASGLDGPYVVQLYASDYFPGWNLDSDVHTTMAYRSEDFEGPVGSLAPGASDYGLDTDGDGLFNFLVFDVPVQVNITAELSVFAYIDDLDLGASNVSTWAVGLQHVALTFDGVAIRASGVNGSFHVRYWLHDSTTREELGMGEYRTTYYAHDQFEEPPAVFAPPHTDYGLDTDGDGLFNYLAVEVRMEVFVSDTYIVSAQLDLGWPSYRTLSAYNETALAAGSASVRLLFDGVFFRLSGRNQSLHVSMSLWSAAHERAFTWGFHASRFYNFTEFEEIPFLLEPPYSDSGLDTDGDGLYNELVLEVRIDASSSGLLWINANLYTSGSVVYATNSTHVEPGLTVVKLRFEGWMIRDRGRDGPYWIQFIVYGGMYGELARDVHNTGAYRSSDFDPSLSIDPTRTTDRGEDVNANGFFDFLAIDVALELEIGGSYVLSASIVFNDRMYVGGDARADLDAGHQVVTVRVNGMALWGIGVDGPYIVNLSLQRLFGDEARTQHTTGPYLAASFEVPSAIFVPPFSESAVDSDGNGLYDAIFVDVTVEVRGSGDFTLAGCLDVVPGYCRVWDTHGVTLESGTHLVRFEMPGGMIRALGADGPYAVDLRLWPTPPGTTSPDWVVFASMETRAYRYEEFEYLARFGAISDRGVDLNGNGRYDFLEVSVEVFLERPGYCTLEGILEIAPGYEAYGRIDGYAGETRLILKLTFEAYYFNTTGQDGPYTLRLVLYALGDRVEASHLTAAYRASDFEV